MQADTIQTFLYKLIDQRGYESSPQEIKDKIYLDLKERLDEFVMTYVVAALSDEDVVAFEKLLDEEKSSEELKQFAKEHIPDYQNFMTATLRTFQDAYLL